MKNFNQGGAKRGGFRPERRSFDRGPVTMHKATCSECGEICEVPFRPTGDKPVYCNKCFAGKREGGERAPRKDFGRRDFVKSDSYKRQDQSSGNEEIKRQLETISNKLDQLTRSLESLTKNKEEKKIDSAGSQAESKPAKKKVAVKKAKKSSSK